MMSRSPAEGATSPSAVQHIPRPSRFAFGRERITSLGRRLLYFWIVWSALLLVHEAGHAIGGHGQGMTARRVTIGAGPVVWRGELGGTETVLRLVPLAGVTSFRVPKGEAKGVTTWSAWERQAITLLGGVGATLALAVGLAGMVAIRERAAGRRFVFGRMLVADAIVLTVFNFLPVPPLDGGRAVVGAISAWRGAPLPADALFWVQLGGLALAVVPMALWTTWTARIDRHTMNWKAPRSGE